MEVIILERIGSRVYRAQKLANGLTELKPDELLERPKNFLLAAKSCDGTYHSVHSEISRLLKKKKELIKKGIVGEIVSALSPDESIHGRRFIIYDSGKKGAYLLGDVISAMRKLSGNANYI